MISYCVWTIKKLCIYVTFAVSHETSPLCEFWHDMTGQPSPLVCPGTTRCRACLQLKGFPRSPLPTLMCNFPVLSSTRVNHIIQVEFARLTWAIIPWSIETYRSMSVHNLNVAVGDDIVEQTIFSRTWSISDKWRREMSGMIYWLVQLEQDNKTRDLVINVHS